MSDRTGTNFLRALAIILVVNSHMNSVYPPSLGFLATGGMIGNALFFMLSSYGLVASMQERPRGFGEWYGRRIVRIYPSVWVVVILLSFPIGIYSGTIHPVNILYEMGKFFYPPFWFLQALLIYYGIIFFIIRNFSYQRLVLVGVPVLVIYALCYTLLLDLDRWSIEQSPFRLIYYFLVVLWGIYLGSQREKLQFDGARDVSMLMLCVLLVYGHKFLMQRGMMQSFQFVQHLLLFPMLYFVVKVAKSNFISHKVMGNQFIGAILTFIGGATLEIFMVNNSIDFLGNRLGMFPVNLLALLALNIGLAMIVFSCAKYIRAQLVVND